MANTWASSANALNSSGLPDGSRKNIVHCSPGSPTKRTCGSITKATSAACQARRESMEVRHAQDDTEVRDRNVVTIHGIRRDITPAIDLVRHNLVSIEVPIDP